MRLNELFDLLTNLNLLLRRLLYHLLWYWIPTYFRSLAFFVAVISYLNIVLLNLFLYALYTIICDRVNCILDLMFFFLSKSKQIEKFERSITGSYPGPNRKLLTSNWPERANLVGRIIKCVILSQRFLNIGVLLFNSQYLGLVQETVVLNQAEKE